MLPSWLTNLNLSKLISDVANIVVDAEAGNWPALALAAESFLIDLGIPLPKFAKENAEKVDWNQFAVDAKAFVAAVESYQLIAALAALQKMLIDLSEPEPVAESPMVHC